jgi:recombination protein RecT
MDVDRVLVICRQAIARSPMLKKCLSISIVSSVIEASQLGLLLDPILGQGYLIPRKNAKLSKAWERDVFLCTFMPGYRGFVHLMRNSGQVNRVNAELVLRDEQFRVELGSDRRIIHNPDYEADGRTRKHDEKKGWYYDETNWRGAYATVKFKDDDLPDFEFLPAGNINDRRTRSESPDQGPWVTDTPEMWKKCPIRAIAKRMPLSPQNRVLEALQRAAIVDEYRESPDYREKEPIAPVLDLPNEEQFVDVEHETGHQTTGMDDGEKKAEPEKEPIRRKSDDKKKKDDAKSAANEPAKPADKKAAEPGEELISVGVANNLRRLAVDEKGMSEKEFIEVLGSYGYERIQDIPKKNLNPIWTEISSRPPKK